MPFQDPVGGLKYIIHMQKPLLCNIFSNNIPACAASDISKGAYTQVLPELDY